MGHCLNDWLMTEGPAIPGEMTLGSINETKYESLKEPTAVFLLLPRPSSVMGEDLDV